MNKVFAVISFYVFTFISIYLLYFFIEPSSNFSLEIANNINFKNGMYGYLVLGLWITLLGVLIILADFLTGKRLKSILNEHKSKP